MPEASDNRAPLARTSVFSWSDAAQLMKLRLAASVVFSAVAGFLLGASVLPDNRWADQLLPLVVLVAGGMLVVGSSNAFNQIWEQKQDALMHRTQGRPLPSGRMSVRHAWAVAVVSGVAVVSDVIVVSHVTVVVLRSDGGIHMSLCCCHACWLWRLVYRCSGR
jgi:heme O synthase-like polyprenyltransferase